MKVHLVCHGYEDDKILPRLARYLRDVNGWTLSEEPDRSADVNAFTVYIEYSQYHSDWHFTKVAAYFSHYEPQTPYKKLWWELALPQADIPFVTADQYGAMMERPWFKARVPVDPQFKIMPHVKHERPLIGVSGFIRDQSRRKGEIAVARLAAELEGHIDTEASGEGWPVKCLTHRWDELPQWYANLDVFLCASTTEGVPMPPLEALACGIPVVIPRGVGMLDDVPDCKGIIRYEAGNYDAMTDALIQVPMDLTMAEREALRDAVSEFTVENWCGDVKRGIENALDTQDTARIERSTHGLRGVYYVALGDPAKKCAKAAMASWKQYMPEIPIALASDEPLGIEDVFVKVEDSDIGGREAKIRIYDLAPAEWRYVLYLDADTEITAPVHFLFEILEKGWDIAITKNPVDYHIIRNMVRDDNKEECEQTFNLLGTDELMQLNGGVFAFARNDRTAAFFKDWLREWRRWCGRDQGALLRALFAHPCKVYVLNNKWNTVVREGYLPKDVDPRDYTAGILHFPLSARRWRGLIHGSLQGDKAWQAVREFTG